MSLLEETAQRVKAESGPKISGGYGSLLLETAHKIKGGPTTYQQAFETAPETLIPGMDQSVVGKQEPSVINKLAGAGEAGLTMLSGATTGAAHYGVNFLQQLAEEIASGEYGSQEAADRIEQAAMKGIRTGTYMPRTETGQAYVENIGEAFSSAPALVPLTNQLSAGIQAFRHGTKGRAILPQSKKKQQIARQLESGDASMDTLGFELKSKDPSAPWLAQGGRAKVVRNPLERQAINQGWRPNVVAPLKGMSKADKSKAQEMLILKERELKNLSAGMDRRPAWVVGDTVFERIKPLRDLNNKASKQLKVVSRALKGTEVNYDDAFNAFTRKLEDHGVLFDGQKFIFDKSQFATLPKIKGLLNKLIEQKSIYSNDGWDVHQFKQYLDKLVTYGKSSKTGLDASIEGYIKTLRHDINTALGKVSEKYRKVNTQYSDTRTVLDDFQSVIGKNKNLYSRTAEEAVGKELRILLGNRGKREQLQDSLFALDDMLVKYGKGNVLKGQEIKNQVLFINELDTRFKPSAQGGFQALIGKEGDRAVDKIMKSKVEMAKDVGKAAYGKAKGGTYGRVMREYNEDLEAIKTMRKLLQQ
jgi:hypothetical protein